jgi:F0F1-type ATP synthase assembly protein I
VTTPEKKYKRSTESLAETLRELLPYTQLGWQLAASILLFFGAGYGLDHLFGSKPWGTILLSVLGIVYGLISVIRTANHLQQRNKKEPS